MVGSQKWVNGNDMIIVARTHWKGIICIPFYDPQRNDANRKWNARPTVCCRAFLFFYLSAINLLDFKLLSKGFFCIPLCVILLARFLHLPELQYVQFHFIFGLKRRCAQFMYIGYSYLITTFYTRIFRYLFDESVSVCSKLSGVLFSTIRIHYDIIFRDANGRTEGSTMVMCSAWIYINIYWMCMSKWWFRCTKRTKFNRAGH